MSHDPLCPFQDTHQPCAGCGLIAQADLRARTDERKRIAQAMFEAMADRIEWDDGTQYIAVADAAWLAQNGGRDE